MTNLSRRSAIVGLAAGATAGAVPALALPAKNTDDMSKFQRDGIGCMIFGGNMVMFDALDLSGDGELIVAKSLSNGENFNVPEIVSPGQIRPSSGESHPGRRMVYVKRHENGVCVYDLCYVIGRVLAANMLTIEANRARDEALKR